MSVGGSRNRSLDGERHVISQEKLLELVAMETRLILLWRLWAESVSSLTETESQ